MIRWTIRGVHPEAVSAIQRVAITTGVSLGEALSAAIRLGANAAHQELQDRNPDLEFVEALERIQNLQWSITQILRSLGSSGELIKAPDRNEPF